MSCMPTSNVVIRSQPSTGALSTIFRYLFITFWRCVSPRSEEHTSELQSRQYLVCRLLLEKKQPARIRRRGPQDPPAHDRRRTGRAAEAVEATGTAVRSLADENPSDPHSPQYRICPLLHNK